MRRFLRIESEIDNARRALEPLAKDHFTKVAVEGKEYSLLRRSSLRDLVVLN